MNDMATNIKRYRSFFFLSNKKLMRARRLYVFLNRNMLKKYRNGVIDAMAIRMQDRGLYSHRTHIRNVRQSINIHYCRVCNPHMPARGGMTWHNWLRIVGINPYTGYFINSPQYPKSRFRVKAVLGAAGVSQHTVTAALRSD